VIKAALVVARGPVLRAEFLPEAIRRTAPATVATTHAAKAESPGDVEALIKRILDDPAHAGNVYRVVVDRVETALVTAALNQTDGRLQQAATLLGISRTTLRQRIQRLGITFRAAAERSDD
jgi:two-component system nitrogen regulation response regulator GlnG